MKLWHIYTEGPYGTGAIVRAETEEQARNIAGEYDRDLLDLTKSTCEELTLDGDAGVIVSYETF